jgi:hypothetical protein
VAFRRDYFTSGRGADLIGYLQTNPPQVVVLREMSASGVAGAMPAGETLDARHFLRVVKRPAAMQAPKRIHILGASGSGTMSLASAIARRYGHRHLDTDDFFWMPTNPPFREKRPREQRIVLLRGALLESAAWVLSGSLCGWGDSLIPEFELVVFLAVPTPVRLMRLRTREMQRYGEHAICQGENFMITTSNSSNGPAVTIQVAWKSEVALCTSAG